MACHDHAVHLAWCSSCAENRRRYFTNRVRVLCEAIAAHERGRTEPVVIRDEGPGAQVLAVRGRLVFA